MIHEAELRRVPLFEGLDDRTIDVLSRGLTLEDLRFGEVIYEQGSTATDGWIVLSGDVVLELPSDSPDGEARVVSTVRRGELVGAVALIDGGNRATRARVGETGARLARLSIEEFERILKDNSELSWRLMELATRRLVRRLREVTAQLREVPGAVQQGAPDAG